MQQQQNYAFDIRSNSELFQYKDGAVASIKQYHQQNQQALQSFVLLQPPPLDFNLKGANVDEYTLFEQLVTYAKFIEGDAYHHENSLNLHRGVIYYRNNVQIDLGMLYIIYLEKALRLSNGWKALIDEGNTSVKKVIVFFARQDIQDEIKLAIYNILCKHKANNRTKQATAVSTEKEATSLFVSKISYACSARILLEEDIRFWLQFSTSYPNWKRAWEEVACFEKLLPVKNFVYKPWLIVIRNKLLQFENSNPKMFSDQQLPILAARILCVINWLSKPKHRNIVIWLLSFLFKETSTDTKRPYLFMHGPPNSGKTFFMDVLAPSAEDGFCMKNRTFSHFGAEKHGEYELHLLLFDDPGEAKGKMNQIDPSLILNLANNNLNHSLPVKFGFMNFRKGQIAIVSNREAQDLFPPDLREAMYTRLLVVELTLTDPFPLRGRSLLCNQLIFQDINLQVTDLLPGGAALPPLSDVNVFFDQQLPAAPEKPRFNPNAEWGSPDISEYGYHQHSRSPSINFDLFHDHDDSPPVEIEEEKKADEEEEKEGDEDAEEVFEKDVIFYVLWRAIFKIVECQLQAQSPSTLKSIIANPKLRELMRNSGSSLFDLICKKIPEHELCKFL